MTPQAELDLLLSRFAHRAICSGGESYYRPSDAMQLVGEARRMGARLLGAEAIRWDGRSVEPLPEFVADFSVSASAMSEALGEQAQRVEERFFQALPAEEDVYVTLILAARA
ncbi:MAG: hypothetical protein ACT4P7_11290 [Gemmatimonadaceae bacterium]